MSTPRFILALAIAAAVPAFAQEGAPVTEDIAPFRSTQKDFEFQVGAAHTDNVLRTPDNKTDDTLASVGIGVDYRWDGRKLDANAIGDVSWVEYLDDSFDGEVAGYFDGSLLWGESTDLLQWQLQDTFGQLRTDPLAASTPRNLENINYLSTGPTLNFRFGPRMWLSVYGSYSIVDYEETDSDYDVRLGGLRLARELRTGTEVSLNAVLRDTEFDNDLLNRNFETRDAFVRLTSEHGRTILSADAGYSELRSEGASSKKPVVRLEISRRASRSSTFYLRASSQYSTASDSLRSDIGRSGAGSPAGRPATADPFREQSASLGWQFQKPRTVLGLSVYVSEEDQQFSALFDRKSKGVEGFFERRMSSANTARLTASLRDEEFGNAGQDSDDFVLGVSLLHELSRRLSLSLGYERYDRSTSNGIGEYTENRVALRASWRPLQ